MQFRFFHWVDRLHVDATSDVVSAIDVFEQATPAADYQYLIDVEGLPSWPSGPDWSKLTDGAALQAEGVDLEQTPNPLGRPVT